MCCRKQPIQTPLIFAYMIVASASLLAQTQPPVTAARYQNQIPSTMGSFAIPEMANATESLVTQTVDLKETIESYAAHKQLAIHEARMETLLFFGMTPRIKATHAFDSNPTFESLGNDRFKVTARKSFFDTFAAMKLCLELGKKQVVVTCQMITITPRQSKRINAFVTPGTAEVYCTKMPSVMPVATAKLGDLEEFETSTFVSSSAAVHQNIPVTTGTISKDNLIKLKEYLEKSQTETNFAPMVVMFPGQLATISDTSKRPFVVGLEAVHNDALLIGMQPIIQAIEAGITVRLKAIPRDDKVQLLSDIAISTIGDVQTFTYASSGEKSQRSFQVPKHDLRQIHLSTLLDPDSAIMIDPNYVQKNTKKGKRKTSQTKALFILQARVIDME